MKNTKLLGFIAAVIAIIVSIVVPESPELSKAAISSMGVLIAVLILFLTDALPIAITCLLGPSLLILLKAVEAAPQAFSGFTNPIIFFVIASFGVSLSISKTNLSKRLLVRLMRTFGGSVERVILAIMLCTAVLSSIMSNVAATVIFISVGIDFLKIYKNEEDKKKSGKAFMISLPIASMIGGMMTPAGSSMNLMVISALEELTGTTMSFVNWMVCGIPIVILMIPVAWKIVVKINKPVEVSKLELDAYIEEIDVKEPLNGKEKYVLVVLTAMITCWVLGSWFPVFNITVVATLGLTAFFIPGVEVFKVEDFMKEVSWSAILLLGSVIGIGNALVSSGASKWIVDAILPSSISLPTIALVFLIGILVYVLLIVIPVAPALVSVLSAPLVLLAGTAGVSPMLLMMTLAFAVCNCFLLPFDTVPLITYMTGYYAKIDLAKTAVWIQLLLAAVVALWLPIAFMILGL